jgi:two-component system OmpR family sensor kinase
MFRVCTPSARESGAERALRKHTLDSRSWPTGVWHHSFVSKGRLTRQELGWLLTQEAQGAAERLRRGVQVLTKPPPPPSQPPPEEEGSAPPPSQPGLGVEASLAALDDVMQMLSSLHAKPAVGRGRRGRIDIASLIWEVAPEARVAIEPGSGTEVFCDEGEIRRMLHVLLGHGSGLGSSVTIKRDGDEVRVAVALGPDSSATADTERAWLARMAIRYGGRYELEGGLESLTLPAGDASARDERDALRKELDEARKQGEAYARELAAVFAQGEELASVASQSSFPPAAAAFGPSEERFAVLSRFAAGVAAELRALLSPLGREIHALKSQQTAAPGMSSRPPPPNAEGGEDRLETMRRRLASVQDFLSALASVGELDPTEAKTEVDVADLARAAARGLATRLERYGVEIDLSLPDGPAMAKVAARAVVVLLRELLVQAVSASPPGGRVRLSMAPKTRTLGVRITVDDSGPALPASARRALLGLELDPGTYGRPSAVPLYVAAEIVGWQEGLLELGDAPVERGAGGGLRVTATFPL